MVTKFAVPFSGAADLDIGGQEMARRGDNFPADQVDESREGAMKGNPKYAVVKDMEAMQSTGATSDDFSIWKKMESF